MMRQLAIAALLATAAGGGAARAEIAADSRQAAVYEEFKREMAAGDLAKALPLAQELVGLIEASEPLSEELPTAYNNLGVVQFRSGEMAAAEKSFGRALELLEATQGIASRRLISPLAGLGAVYAAGNQHARAAEVLAQALAISRRADGLFNLDQLGILDALIRSYEALGAVEGVDREQRYALQVVQQQYGYDDPRTLPNLERLAAWYERTSRFAPARALWVNTVEIASREGGGRNAATINGLLGITRSYRLQYVRDPESLAPAEAAVDPLTGRVEPLMPMSSHTILQGSVKLDRDGEAAAKKALEILDATPDPPRPLLVRALLELGDWYITAHDPADALPFYQRAWPLIPGILKPGEQNPLSAPRPMHYRPPSGALRLLGNADVETVSRRLEFDLTIAATGEVTEVIPVTTDAPELEMTQVARALNRAWFSPRFEDGQAVATEGYRYVEYWFERAPEQPEAPATPPAAPPAAPPEDSSSRPPSRAG